MSLSRRDGQAAEAAPGATLRVFLQRRTLVMLGLGFASGLPNLLIFDTLSAWLRDAGLSLEVIGIFSLATLAYSFKFLWAPLVDRLPIPLIQPLLGRRRSWMLACQILVMFGLWLVAGTDPARNLGATALFAVLVGFVSATQDIVVDAWRIEAAPDSHQGVMAAAYQWGYRLAMIVAGAAPLILAEAAGWSFSYAVMAALMGVGAIATLAAPREPQTLPAPAPGAALPARPLMEAPEWFARLALFALGAIILGSGLAGDAGLLAAGLKSAGLAHAGEGLAAVWEAKPGGVFVQLAGVVAGGCVIILAALPVPGRATRPGAYLSAALGDPLRDFFRRYAGAAGLILALICLYRLSDFVLNIMNPFYLDLGFSKTEIAEVRKLFGVVMSMLGVFAGGYAVARYGLMRALLAGALAGPLSNLVFAWLTLQGPSLHALFVAIGVDNLASGFAGTCLIAYMSSLTSGAFTATQYALFSSLYSLPGKLLASQSGRIVEAVAATAQAGGWSAPLGAAALPGGFVEAATRSGVTPPALAAGYVGFFLYSALIGLVGVVLTLGVFLKARQAESAGQEAGASDDPQS